MPQKGDIVTIAGGEVTWKVLHVCAGVARLESGLTGRHRWEPIERLKLFPPKTS